MFSWLRLLVGFLNRFLDQVKRSTQGKLAAATQVQSAEYLKPLFKQLRSRTMAADVLAKLAEIVHFMQKREYQKANDAYLRLSIGNAAWPIGVTMVGYVYKSGSVDFFLLTELLYSIHERSAREKISSDQVAHVLNDEVSRKYIQSVKRWVLANLPYPWIFAHLNSVDYSLSLKQNTRLPICPSSWVRSPLGCLYAFHLFYMYFCNISRSIEFPSSRC